MQYLAELSLTTQFNNDTFQKLYAEKANRYANAYTEGLKLADEIIIYNSKKDTTMNENMKAKREELKAISAGFKMLVKEGAIDSINTGLTQYYAEQGNTTLKSYRQWRKEGYQVKKGSKALLLWGEPKPIHKPGQEPAQKPGQEPGQEETFFPLAYVFSNLHVQPIQ